MAARIVGLDHALSVPEEDTATQVQAQTPRPDTPSKPASSTRILVRIFNFSLPKLQMLPIPS